MTERALSPQQAFLIYSMLFGDDQDAREPKQSKAGLDKAPREVLVEAGLVRKETRKRSTHLILTATGYQWAADNLGAELKKTTRAAPLLQAVLLRLRGVGLAKADALKAFALGTEQPNGTPSRAARSTGVLTTKEAVEIETRIRDAYLTLTGGVAKQRVLLKDLRPRIDAPRQEVDDALLAMQERRLLVLMKLDNPSELTPDDEAASLRVAGHPRHLLYFQV
jgi:hypothetical protein